MSKANENALVVRHGAEAVTSKKIETQIGSTTSPSLAVSLSSGSPPEAAPYGVGEPIGKVTAIFLPRECELFEELPTRR